MGAADEKGEGMKACIGVRVRSVDRVGLAGLPQPFHRVP